MKLISDKMCKALDDLTAFCFLGNRIFDRAHSVLDVNFVMPNTAEVVHLNMAHQFPLLADLITDYCSDRGYAQKYLMTPEDVTEYALIDEILGKLFNYTVDLENMTIDTIKIAEEEKDRTTKKFLDNFLLEASKYTAMALRLVDFAEANKGANRNMDYDARIKKYLGLED